MVVDCCVASFVVARCVLFVVRSVVLVVWCSWFVVSRSLFTVCCAVVCGVLLFVVRCSLCVVCRSLFVAVCRCVL